MGRGSFVQTSQAVEGVGNLARKCGAALVTLHWIMENSLWPNLKRKQVKK
jgi:hypothetical protein